MSNVYYWQSLEALQTLMQHPAHLKARPRRHQSMATRVVIAQVLRTCGDNQLTGLLPTARLFTRGTAPTVFQATGKSRLAGQRMPPT